MPKDSDYSRVAAAIQFLNDSRLTQPSLDDVAAHVGLSPFHFERLFVRWAGVSPKKYLQFLTKEHASALLRQNHSVLDSALESGLSGPGRLHDLLVTCEGVSPGEMKTRGAGLMIRHGRHESPFGRCEIGITERGLCALHFGDDPGAMTDDWPGATFVRDDPAIAGIARKIFSDSPGAGAGLRVFLRGSAFQLAVWQALLRIPPGAVTTYQAIARAIGQDGASRAVGGAVGANPVAWLIPCHRVLRASGDLGGYRWDPTRKAAMLLRESSG